MEWLSQIEFSILYGLQELHHPVLDMIMVFITKLGDHGYFWIGLGIVLLVIKKHRRAGLQILMSMLVTYVVGNLILKNLFARQRPCAIDPTIELLIPYPSEFSFPSGHTMNGFTAAFAVFFNNRKLGTIALIIASLIAFSRMYHFVHFPTDILGGFLIGFGVAILMNYIFDKVQARRTA